MVRRTLFSFSLIGVGLLSCAAATAACAQESASFQSPSGNIGCIISDEVPTYARCDIREYTPSVVNDQGLCELEYGDSYSISGGATIGEVVCHGDTVFDDNAPVLKYGQEISLGDITCRSEKTGMICSNNTGAGFSMARAKQEIF